MPGLQFTYKSNLDKYNGPADQGVLIKNRGNNAKLSSPMAMPQKFYPSAGDSMFSNARHIYKNDGGGGSLMNGHYDASQVTALNRLNTIGKSSMINISQQNPLSFRAQDTTSRNSSLRRCRSGGCVAPKKKGAIKYPANSSNNEEPLLESPEPYFKLIVYEGFDYPINTVVNGLNGGSGEWITPWENAYLPGSYMKIGSGTTYNNLDTIGNGLVYGSGASNNPVASCKRMFNNEGKGIVYIKILMSAIPSVIGEGGTPRIGFYNNDTFLGGIGNSGTPSNMNKLINIYDSSLTYVTTTNVSITDTRLLLILFNYNTNTGKLWINPDLSNFSYESPNLIDSTDLGSAWVFNTFNVATRSGVIYDEFSMAEYITP